MLSRYKIRWEYVPFVVIVAVGVAARLIEVHYNFNLDELFSVKLASKQFPEVISGSLRDRTHPPLHNILLHVWINLFGASEVSARTLSVLFSAVFLVMSYALLRRFVTKWLGLGLLLILALSPLLVKYGQEARPYALITCLATANLLAFVRVLDVPHDCRRVSIWAVSCALLLYSQYIAILSVAFQMAVALLYLRSERLTIIAYGFAGSALILPWMIAAMAGAVLGGTDPLSHISWMGPPTPTAFFWFYFMTFGSGPEIIKADWLLLLLAFLGMAYIRRLVTSKSLPAHHVLFFLIAVGLPAVIFVVSVWGPKPLFAYRQLLGASIAFVVAIGLCMASLPRTLAAGLLLILLAWSAWSLPEVFPNQIKPPWRDMAAQIDEKYGSMAVVTQDNWIRKPLDYYRRLGPVRLESDLGEIEERNRVLFVCGIFESKCSDIENKVPESRRSPLATWRWGSEASGYLLRLYEIRGVTELAPTL